MDCENCNSKVENYEELTSTATRYIGLAIDTMNKLTSDLKEGKGFIHVCDYYRKFRDKYSDLSDNEVFGTISAVMFVLELIRREIMVLQIMEEMEDDIGDEYAS